MINILYIADPNSIHDLKWMSWFAEQQDYNCHLVSRAKHQQKDDLKEITYQGNLKDYSIFKPWQNKTGSKILSDIIKNQNIDLIHVFYAEPNLLWLNAIKTEIPIVLTTRGSDVLVGLKYFINYPSLKNKVILKSYQKVLLKCNIISSTSSKQASYLVENFKLNTKPEIIRTGIDIEAIKTPKNEKNIIFFPRNMQPLYNHELAIAALVKIPIEIQSKYKFVFVNKNSENKSYVSKIENLLSVFKNLDIEFKDSMSGAEYYNTLAQSELVIMTPNSDGAPVSGMEAIASCSKLILPQLDYDTDLFSSAYFYEPKNVSSLASVILEALNSHTKNLDEHYIQSINRATEMQKLADLYKKIIPQ